MFFLQPIWLTAMAGVMIPVIVHLWNVRRGKVVRIGSIALLESSTRRLARSWRLTQWWLLVLRCLLVMTAALLLAGPYRLRHATGKGWVLVEGGGGPYAGFIDSLVKAGYERHVLADSVNYWEGFRIADREAVPGEAFYVVTTGLAAKFSGERPATNREVHWEAYTPVDSVVQWTQAAWRAGDSVRVLAGVSRSTGTMFNRGMVGEGAAGPAVDTTVLRYKIVADRPYKEDGKYIAAAMKTLQQEVWRPMEEGEGGWLFWLSDRPAPVTGYLHVFTYTRGKEMMVETRMEGVRMMKEIGGAPVGGIWQDGFGRGVLVKEGENYRYFSRLGPGWSDLVWSGRFPVMLEELMVKREEAGVRDRRMMDPGQITPVEVGRRKSDARPSQRGASGPTGVALTVRRENPARSDRAADLVREDLGPVVWVVLVILFVLERIIAFSNGDRKT